MSVILIDYENVSGYGLLGIDLLNASDTLEIFYSMNSNKIRHEHFNIIEETGCSFKTCKLLNRGPDYLDKYIATATGVHYKSGETEIAIISKDKGFQAVIDYYKVIGADGLRIVKAENIEQALISFGDPADHERRSIITKRSEQISLDEISIKLREMESIQIKIRKALINTPYWYRTTEVYSLIIEHSNEGKRTIYASSMHNWGRDEGRAIYNLIKDVV